MTETVQAALRTLSELNGLGVKLCAIDPMVDVQAIRESQTTEHYRFIMYGLAAASFLASLESGGYTLALRDKPSSQSKAVSDA